MPPRTKTTDGPLSAQLRAAVDTYLSEPGRTYYTLGKATGVSLQVITRWHSRERDIRLETADRLARVLLPGGK